MLNLIRPTIMISLLVTIAKILTEIGWQRLFLYRNSLIDVLNCTVAVSFKILIFYLDCINIRRQWPGWVLPVNATAAY